MICSLSLISTARSLMFSLLVTEGLAIRGDLHLFVISLLTRLTRLSKGLMGKLLMEGKLWSSLLSVDLMLKESLKGGFLNQWRSWEGQGAVVLVRDTEMNIETRAGGKVVVEVGTDLPDYRGRDRDYHHRSRNCSLSPDYRKDRERSRYDDARHSRSRSRGRDRSSDARDLEERSPVARSVSPRPRAADSRTPSTRNSDAEE